VKDSKKKKNNYKLKPMATHLIIAVMCSRETVSLKENVVTCTKSEILVFKKGP